MITYGVRCCDRRSSGNFAAWPGEAAERSTCHSARGRARRQVTQAAMPWQSETMAVETNLAMETISATAQRECGDFRIWHNVARNAGAAGDRR
jgi:hypothetical protein